MRKIKLLIIWLLTSVFVQAQLLSWSPSFPVENDVTNSFIITMDAAKGNQGLLNYTPSGDVYVHTGVITNYSTSASDWKHVRSFGVADNLVFTTAIPQLQATYIGNNKWQFTISGGLRSYYGLTDANEHIQKIAILFRTGNGTKKQTNSDGSDMYIPIYTTALAVRITDPFFEPTYKPTAEIINKSVGDNLNVSAITNNAATLKFYLNGTEIQSASNATSISKNIGLTIAGNNKVIAEANDGNSIAKDSLSFFVSGGINTAPLPAGVRDGINYETDNTAVTLVLYAPFKSRVSVIGDLPNSNWTEQPQYQMNKSADGKYWWLRITGLTPGTEYSFQYVVDGTLRIADPYAEKIQDPYNNNDQNIPTATYANLKPYPAAATGIVSILQTQSPTYNWSGNVFSRPDKRGLVIYEMLVRDFVANHDWKTIRDTLSYLKTLGINAIEIMPFNEFEGNNSWGYNPDFYFAPDKYYGPKNNLKEFVDSCHSKGIAVIMDIALNHSFGLSPMVQLYFDAANNRPATNNPWFNPVAKHAFNVGYDMNHESTDTRYFVSRVVEHWLKEYKLDGFRFDLSKGFTQTQTCDNSGGNCDVNGWSNYDASRVAIWKRYYDTVQSKSSNAYVILEHFAANTEEIELSNYGMMLWGNMNYNYAQASMGYPQDWNFDGGIFTKRGWSKPNLVTYMESHDEERIMYKNLQYGNASGSYNIKEINTALKRSEMAAAFLLTIPGPKMIWQFGELGYDYSINYCTNGTVNNNCRLDAKPIRWDYKQSVQRKQLYDVYSSLLKLRQHQWYKDVFMSDKITYNLADTVKWIKLATDTSSLFVVGNFGVNASTANISFPQQGTWYDYLAGTTVTATGSAQNMPLQPGEYHVYVNRNVNNVVTTPVSNVPGINNDLQFSVYPNPATAGFFMDVNIPQSGNVVMQLFNLQGVKVGELFNGFMAKGNHVIAVDRKKLPSGIYFVNLKGKNADATIKIIFR